MHGHYENVHDDKALEKSHVSDMRELEGDHDNILKHADSQQTEDAQKKAAPESQRVLVLAVHRDCDRET